MNDKIFLVFLECSYPSRLLLWSPNVDVSYFAAGIVAHLVCASQDSWQDSTLARGSLLEELVSHVYLKPIQ